MTEQKTEAELAAEKAKADADAQAAADAEAQDDANHDDDGDTAKDDDDESAQLKADLAAEKAARKKAEDLLAAKGFKDRKNKRDTKTAHGDANNDDQQADDTDDDAGDDDKPLTRAEFNAALAQERETTRKATLATEAVRIAAALSDNLTMQELILEKWKNRSYPADLSLQDQIEECFLAANKKRIIGENKELKRALVNKRNVNKDTTSTHQDEVADSHAPSLPAADKSEFARLGYKWNTATRQYEKKLINGSRLVIDSKTKKTTLIKA